ncbi:MAG: dihydrolipoamide acetyltransferase family protein [Planctomycetota bacterium]|jgi:pyruvate dehydrogenase E2 component (dihydrolipoamide acetyltransferase)|nr:dihydrolipoamide acetyltransferase family protein [Planctomycetota bacterium]
MATPVILPKQGNSVESCIIQQWLKSPGDTVSAGDALCEVETDKAVMEVEAPCDGVLIELFAQADDDVPVLTNIAAIGDAGEDVSALRPDGAGGDANAAPAATEQPAAEAVEAVASSAAPAVLASAADAGGAGGSSPRARSLATGASVSVGDLAGTGPEGRVIERDVQAAIAGSPKLTPAAQARLAQGGLAAPARGTGPAGTVLVGDLVPAAQAAAVPAPLAAAPAAGTTTEIPVKGIRKIIAERMRQSLGTTAQLTMTAGAKATALQAYRAKVKGHAEALGLPNITIGDMIVYAVSRVLPRFPECNAHFLGDKVVQFGDVNIGVAVDTDRGLMVPVIPGANQRSLADLAAWFKPVAKSCQAGNVDPAVLSGGTFTVTNLGNLGIDTFTPVLNAPEVAILGVGGLCLKPYRAADGSVEHVDTITFSLTIDHQALDGAPAARFLHALVAAIENFELLLAQ